MKNYKVQAISNFKDKTIHQARRIGDIFICNEERYNELELKKVISLIEVIEEKEEVVNEEEVKEVVKEKPKRKRINKNSVK